MVGRLRQYSTKTRDRRSAADVSFPFSRRVAKGEMHAINDCGFSSFADDTSTSRDTAFAKIRNPVEGTAMAGKLLGV